MKVADASLVITVLNEAESILPFLETVRAQAMYPREIVIVDGGSSDGTVDAIRAWTPPSGVSTTLIESPGANISKGRNIAIYAARFERILVTDAGTELHENWVAALISASSKNDSVVVSGFYYPKGRTWLERAIAFTITPALSEIDADRFLPSSRSVSFTRKAWRAAGGYPEWLDYCEDLVFDFALKTSGEHFVFESNALVSWTARPSLASFFKQYYRYARGDGKADLWRKRHAARYSAYILGVAIVVVGASFPSAWIALLACVSAYFAKFWGRIARRKKAFGSGALAAVFIVPVVVVTGDIAKMLGYPVGVQWRLRHRHRIAAAHQDAPVDRAAA